MNFKQWIENDQIGKLWASNTPTDYPFIDSEVNKFAEDMCDSLRNAIYAYKILTDQKFGQRTFYGPKNICGNLLNIKSSKYLEIAVGGVTEDRNAIFAMKIMDDDKASIIILNVPMVYDYDDKLLLRSSIIHELRHAADYHEFRSKGGNPKDFSSEHLYEINLELYAKHIHEARAYAEQLRWLMKKLNNKTDVVMALLSGPLGISDSLHQFAQVFLKELTNESYQHHLEPPSIVDTDTQDQVVNLLKKIFEIMRFSNNVRKL